MSQSQKFNEISPEKLHNWLQQDSNIYLIHVQPVEVYKQRHIPGSKNACVYEVTFPDQVENIVSDRDKPVVLYGTSSSGNEAKAAAEKLNRMNYAHIYILTGGIAGWRASDYELAGQAPDDPLDPATTIQLRNGRYPVDIKNSVIEWRGRNPNGSHWGTVQLSSGTLSVNDGRLEGEFDIDMTTIKNIDLEGDELQPVLLAHLESDDFFFTRLFPKARFVITGSEAINELTRSAPNFHMKGHLELRGVAGDIQFPATISVSAEGKLIAEAHFDLDRTRWNVLYGSSRFFEHLGMHLVFDPISVQVRLVTI